MSFGLELILSENRIMLREDRGNKFPKPFFFYVNLWSYPTHTISILSLCYVFVHFGLALYLNIHECSRVLANILIESGPTFAPI